MMWPFKTQEQPSKEDSWWCLRRLKITKAHEGLAGEVLVRPAMEAGALLECWRLVHQRYVEVGLLDKDAPLWVTPYHFLPETRFFATYLEDEGPLSVAGIVFDGKAGLPADALFRDCLDRLRQGGRRLVEIFSLASRPHLRARNTLFHLFRVLYRYALFCKATDLLIAIHPKHTDFYERLLLFSRLGDCRHHFQFAGTSFILEHLDLKRALSLYRRVYRDFPKEYNLYHFFAREPLPEERLFSEIKRAKIDLMDFPTGMLDQKNFT